MKKGSPPQILVVIIFRDRPLMIGGLGQRIRVDLFSGQSADEFFFFQVVELSFFFFWIVELSFFFLREPPPQIINGFLSNYKNIIFPSQNGYWAFCKFLLVAIRAKSVFPRVGVSAQGHYEKLAFKDEFLFEKSV